MIYPLLLSLLSMSKKQNNICYTKENTPGISIIIAAHNEESVIGEKLKSIIENDYLNEKIEVLIGSDHSTDQTNPIIQSYADKFSFIKLTEFSERKGKAAILNQLCSQAQYPVLILSDANVFFERNCLFELSKHFKNEAIGIVGAKIINRNIKPSGISIQESLYTKIEVKLKYYEGKIWGTMIGAFGACYAIRKACYSNIDKNILMEDFFLTMQTLTKRKKAILELNAICYEDVSNKLNEEFRRKARISTGNYQNLKHFRKLLCSNIRGLSFSFISHKVLRWLGPFFLILLYISSAYIMNDKNIYWYCWMLQNILFGLILTDSFFRLFKINIVFLRFITHFYSMNVALLLGFFNYLKGVESGVWQPTKRNQ